MGMYVRVRAIKPADVESYLAEPDDELINSESDPKMAVNLEKAWHGLHYLLTGSATEGRLPLAFLLQGGEAVGEDDGYGPPRLFAPADVAALHAALSPITDDKLWGRFDPVRMSEEGVYPEIWDEPESDIREEYLFYFNELKNLVKKAAAEKCGLLVMLT